MSQMLVLFLAPIFFFFPSFLSMTTESQFSSLIHSLLMQSTPLGKNLIPLLAPGVY